MSDKTVFQQRKKSAGSRIALSLSFLLITCSESARGDGGSGPAKDLAFNSETWARLTKTRRLHFYATARMDGCTQFGAKTTKQLGRKESHRPNRIACPVTERLHRCATL